MMYSTAQLSIIGLAALSIVSAGRDPSKEAKQQYAKQWQSLSKSCQASLMTIADSKSDISKCTHAGKLFNNVVTNSAVVSDYWEWQCCSISNVS